MSIQDREMQVDISKLSAKELFELAKEKEQEEKEESVRQAVIERVEELAAQREKLVAAQEKELEEIDKKIVELTEQRAALTTRHEKALAESDKEIGELNKKLGQKPAAAEAKKSTAASRKSKPEPAAKTGELADQPMDAGERIIEMLKVRSYVSHGMLDETLRSEGIDVSDLSRKIDQLVRQKKIVRRSGGNYALKK